MKKLPMLIKFSFTLTMTSHVLYRVDVDKFQVGRVLWHSESMHLSESKISQLQSYTQMEEIRGNIFEVLYSPDNLDLISASILKQRIIIGSRQLSKLMFVDEMPLRINCFTSCHFLNSKFWHPTCPN